MGYMRSRGGSGYLGISLLDGRSRRKGKGRVTSRHVTFRKITHALQLCIASGGGFFYIFLSTSASALPNVNAFPKTPF